MTESRKIPVGRMGRLARLAGVGARTGASLLLSKNGESGALRAAEVLGTLRGLAAKVGQMASYVDGVLPEEHRDAYERALSKLRTAAPSSSPLEVRRIIEQELGAPPEEAFAEWDPEPLASASIGQVHRARLSDGRRVAVKVQHPGIAVALENDLNNAGVVQRLVSMVGPRALNAQEIFEEVRARFREELDYELEARHQTHFRKVHAGDPTIRIPAVIGEKSTKRVLTTELVHGQSLEEAASADSELRRRYAETLWRFVFKGNLVGEAFNADPHPGNYIFHPDGAITFLDFGCVQPLGGIRLEHARAVHRAALGRDEARFEIAVVALLGLRGGRYQKSAVGYVRQCFEPLFASPFLVSREYVTNLVREAQSMKRDIFAKDGSFVAFPKTMVMLNRLQFGFYSVLSRLDVETDYAATERAFLEEAGLL